MKKFFVRNEKIAVLGAGSWGTTLAILLSRRHKVKVWDYDKEQCDKMNRERENKKFLPGVAIPEKIFFSSDADEILYKSNIVIFAIPTHFIRSVLKNTWDKVRNKILINVAKGIENKSLKRISEILYETTENPDIYTLSGPSHAEEVSRKVPTTVVIAGLNNDLRKLRYLQKIFITEYFRVYTNEDITGVELGGSLKNIIAIACGISDGLGFGSNTKAALMTRGLAEIQRLGIKMGAQAQTFAGLAGIGDLITTCISPFSRNRYVGEELGKGRKIRDILDGMVMVAEGVKTTLSAYSLAQKHKVNMPIIEEVHHIIYRKKNTLKAVKALMTRDPKPEHWR
ncbi:MAG: NAD(P)-dependent glycerol-3-phosphate dehydrogenase [bacterium]|nr:NAD(P)-dependent glycerol-3-phosphate dehydrogenase [bacterium]